MSTMNQLGKYQPYPDYKDSGVEWLGEIPIRWNVTSLKRKCTLVTGLTPPTDNVDNYSDDGFPWVRPEDISETTDKVSASRFVSESAWKSLRKIPAQSTLICCIGTIGKCGYTSDVITTNQQVTAASFTSASRYYYYHIIASRKQLEDASTGNVLRILNNERLGSLRILSPSAEEAEKIATFLDYETARIDQLIAKQQQLIELLKEKRQAVISHAVKLRPNKKHVKISHVIDLLTGFPFPSNEFKQSGENKIRLLRGVNVGVDQVKWDDTVFWDSQNCDSLKGYHLQCGDIVFGMDRPWISNGARVAEISNDDMPCMLLQRVARIRANHLAYQPFIKLCLASNEFRAYVEADLTGVSVPHISPEQIKNFIIRDLSYEEQVSVTTDALNKLWKLKILEQTALNAIELIQERRTALISAAVTGKIDLRGWQPPQREVAA